ncbi:MAG TPA: acetyl-CoA carboxylase biotin carboxylase subunit [Thermoanaerobaculia bacterium]|nr:acetyl-CoA carboxylase biotin carboxylase subunit [Thermoanaerobaculia bacterium]HUM30462.1 acetyl-CoA carboxylase biotin carboxylase subunit [Thermoanaerobaculia bacterium]HXK68671.1 acetyl-CoA carboxylase biotin carboxylase subunit [Thermoanaerobaculia bacterium]
MFSKILIANRGEIAVRIIHACRELGISTVAVYSEIDRDALHVRLADESVCIGPPPSQQSYLNYTAIISAAEVKGVDAIHPGYGFLAENPHFVEICNDCNIIFIGPTVDVMHKMGDKISARNLAKKAGVPILPGTLDPVSNIQEAGKIAQKIGYPIILKAAAGGGGRGMRIVRDKTDLATTFATASQEAELAFGDGRMYIETYLEEPRHIEIQILADRNGKILHLGERECSIQRRHQKLIEESPSPALTPAIRKKMGDAAVKLASACNYIGAGTVEFLLDARKNFYFMEMNTRIQVEHPVTEEVTGFDLVKEQIQIAADMPLSFSQNDVIMNGHAIEFRINAEDPVKFTPCPGTVQQVIFPGGPGVRVDTHIYPGYRIPPTYDSLIAKLILRGRNREESLLRARRALTSFILEGVSTTIPLYTKILDDRDFQKGKLSTHFLQRYL